TRATVTLDRGESTAFAGYQVTFERSEEHRRPGRSSTDAHISFSEGGSVVRVAEPRLTSFRGQAQAVGVPSVWSRPGSDVYVALAQLNSERVTLNLYRYPLMVWMSVAGALVVAGGFWALGGRRRDQAAEPARPHRDEEVTTGA
ncbi:MAG: cytochrome c-type biogenesis CcmF C-terminal domain-containing protein, partial [Pseudonocardiaceae bacterium]